MRADTIDISILIIYTGGTIGMIQDENTGSLVPFKLEYITEKVPELKQFGYDLDTVSFKKPVDSSNITPADWIYIAEIIEENYYKYDGFVVLHGTDTMAYSASALSFLLENLQKPVIFTGSQLPLGELRTDARDNIIAAVEIAAAQSNHQPTIPEVCIFFENKLIRGNRATKINSEQFNAFASNNYPVLAESGVYIKYNFPEILNSDGYKQMTAHKKLDDNIAVLKLFPALNEQVLLSILNIDGLKGLIIESYGAGTAPEHPWFIKHLSNAVKNGLIILNVSQCQQGQIEQTRYKTSYSLEECGVIGGYDITTEAATAKLMFLLAQELSRDQIINKLNESLRGEITR